MWLINTSTLRLESFTPPKLPKYAILSHTWGEEEVSFADMRKLRKAKKKVGFSKIQKTCQLARVRGMSYAWVDTCCIDKSSSAELSESINSMYKWYRQSQICYAYLEDWSPEWRWNDLSPLAYEKMRDTTQHILCRNISSSDDEGPALMLSQPPPPLDEEELIPMPPLKWFTRGWTLQELIAPTEVEFYDSKWNRKGSKSEVSVVAHLSRITGIRPDVLKDGGESNLRRVSVGQRMSWAAPRDTTRIEDLAYCLLGIFQVNMPMLYGEGGNAFVRLQEEIIKSSTDLSIFAWCQRPEDTDQCRGVLSRHPREFSLLQDCELIQSRYIHAEEILITNKGFRLHKSMFYPSTGSTPILVPGIHFMDLGCRVACNPQGIYLTEIHGTCVRVEPRSWIQISDLMRRDDPRTFYLARDMNHVSAVDFRATNEHAVRLRFLTHSTYHFEFMEMWPRGIYDPLLSIIQLRDDETVVGFIKFYIINDITIPDRRRRVGESVLACVAMSGSMSMYPLYGQQAESFEATLRSTWNMDATTAENTVVRFFVSIQEELATEAVIPDSTVEKMLHVTVEKYWDELYEEAEQRDNNERSLSRQKQREFIVKLHVK